MTKSTTANSGVVAAAPGVTKSTGPFFSRGGLLRRNSGDALLALLRLRGGTISEVRGVRWCEEFKRGMPLFIVLRGDRRTQAELVVVDGTEGYRRGRR